MKKALFLLSLVLISAVSFSSCLSSLFARQTYMKNFSELPANESTVVVFDNTSSAIILLKKWNNIDIGDFLYGTGYIGNNDKSQLTVPPGDNSFTFDIFYTYGKTTYERKNIELQYFLSPGTRYIVKPSVKEKTAVIFVTGLEFFIGIYPDVKKSEPLKEWKLGES